VDQVARRRAVALWVRAKYLIDEVVLLAKNGGSQGVDCGGVVVKFFEPLEISDLGLGQQ
jgi:hypothetical protein